MSRPPFIVCMRRRVLPFLACLLDRELLRRYDRVCRRVHLTQYGGRQRAAARLRDHVHVLAGLSDQVMYPLCGEYRIFESH